MGRLTQFAVDHLLPLAIALGLIIAFAVGITFFMYRKHRGESSDGENAFADFLWLTLGCGLVSVVVCYLLSALVWLVPNRETKYIAYALSWGGKYACAPGKFRARHSRNNNMTGIELAFALVLGVWFGFLELLIGVLYSCTILGLYFGKKHILIGRILLSPCQYRVMSLVDYEEYYAARLMEGR